MCDILYKLILNCESLMPVNEDVEFKKSNELNQMVTSYLPVYMTFTFLWD